MEEWGLLIIFAVWGVSFLFFRLSGALDGCVFDPLYGTEKEKQEKYAQLYKGLSRIFFPVTFLVDCSRITQELDDNRKEAVRKLKYPTLEKSTHLRAGERMSGIYGSAKKIFGGREEWEDEVKSRLEYSKAARVFIFPLLVVLVWEVVHCFAGWPPYIPVKSENKFTKDLVLLFEYPLVVYLALQVPTFLYLYLRIAHMSNLYSLVTESKIFRFEVNVKENGQREMLSVGSVVVPVCEVGIFRKKILCVGIDDGTRKKLEDLEDLCPEVKTAKNVEEMEKLAREEEFNIFVISSPSLPQEVLRKRLLGGDSSKDLIVYPSPKIGAADVLARAVKEFLVSNP